MTQGSGTQQSILVVGATSAIAARVARIFAARHAQFCLVARDPDKLETVSIDLLARGASDVKTIVADMASATDVEGLLPRIREQVGGLDVVLIAHGLLSDAGLVRRDAKAVAHDIFVNYTSIAMFLTDLANYLEVSRRGTLAVIGSVAGDRGRQSNYIYGASKAALDALLSGLRNRLFSSGVHVLTIKPGFVRTPMTAHVPHNLLFASPERVARSIVQAIENRKNIVYIPWFWRPIMWVIKALPESIFKRLKL